MDFRLGLCSFDAVAALLAAAATQRFEAAQELADQAIDPPGKHCQPLFDTHQ